MAKSIPDFKLCDSLEEAINSEAGQLGLITTLRAQLPHKEAKKYFEMINLVLDSKKTDLDDIDDIDDLDDIDDIDDLDLLDEIEGFDDLNQLDEISDSNDLEMLDNYIPLEDLENLKNALSSNRDNIITSGQKYINNNIEVPESVKEHNITAKNIESYISSEINKTIIGMMLNTEKYDSSENVEEIYSDKDCSLFREGKEYFFIYKGNKNSYLDKYDNVEYDSRYGFKVKQGELTGIIDFTANFILPLSDYNSIVFKKEYGFIAKKGAYYGVYDFEGNQLINHDLFINISYDDRYGFMVTNDDFQKGIFAKDGILLVPCIHDKIVYVNGVFKNRKLFGFELNKA